MEKTANRLKQLREKASLNQTQLAKKTGISEQSISKYERGERKPKIENLEALANFFKVPVSYLRGKAAVNRLKELRQSKGLTLDDIEKATGINRGTYSNYENGNTEPRLETWQKLANYFGVSTAYLLKISEEPNKAHLMTKAVIFIYTRSFGECKPFTEEYKRYFNEFPSYDIRQARLLEAVAFC